MADRPCADDRTMTAPVRARDESERACLLIVSCPDARAVGRAIPIPPAGIRIGRDPDSGKRMRIPDRMMSRSHAQLWITEAGLCACRDLDSKNGTFVGGEKVATCYLEPGAVLRCAATVFVLASERPEDDTMGVERTGLVGPSARMGRVRRAIEAGAEIDTPVLLLGETGTGKDVAARALHELSGRPGKLQAVNCATIPENLLESTLFGHVRGAFTGATESQPGLLVSADRGTLFLDEVDELPPVAQAALLRVVEDGIVTPVGSTRERKVRVRLIAATARDLFALEERGAFRTDLLGRLNDYRIDIPPLRERREDILPLVEAFWREARGKWPDPPLEADTVEALLVDDWRHNVRALRRLVLRAATLHKQARTLELDMLPPELKDRVLSRGSEPGLDLAIASPAPSAAGLEAALREADGNLSEVATALGKDRKQVYRWLKRYGIDPSTFRK